jgi:hypothetical protein
MPWEDLRRRRPCRTGIPGDGKSPGYLPEKYRTVIILRYFNGLAINEIAAALGIPFLILQSK